MMSAKYVDFLTSFPPCPHLDLIYRILADFPRRCSLLKGLNFAPHLSRGLPQPPAVSEAAAGGTRGRVNLLNRCNPHALYRGNSLYRGI